MIQNTEYVVERILDKKKIGTHTYYLVKWKDYKISESTWEPIQNLENVRDLIREFNETITSKISSYSIPKCSNQSDIISHSTEDYSYTAKIIPDRIKIRKVFKKDNMLQYKVEIETQGKLSVQIKSSEEMMRDHLDMMISFLESKIRFI